MLQAVRADVAVEHADPGRRQVHPHRHLRRRQRLHDQREELGARCTFASPGDPILTFTVAKPVGHHGVPGAGPAALTPANDADLEVTIVDLGTNHVWDFMGVARTGATTFRASAYGDGDLNGTGFGYFPAGGGTRVRAGVRASGASWLGGLVTGENLAPGRHRPRAGHRASATTT